nr:TerD family protein [Klebsiella variicola]
MHQLVILNFCFATELPASSGLWSSDPSTQQKFDLFNKTGENGKVLSDSHFVFYNNTTSPDGAVQHQGDNRTGEGDGDDEQVKIDLTKVAADVKKLVFAVTIHEADSRKQNFGMVSNSFMRVVNNDNGSEIARFDLSEDASTETAMIFGELYRHGAEWKFKAVGQGFAGGLAALATQHGINI